MKIKNLTPELMVDDVQESINFYTDILDFKVTISVPEKKPFFVTLKNGGVELMLYHRNQFAKEIPKFKKLPIGGSIVMYIGVEDIKSFYDRVKNKVKIIQTLHQTDYGSTEFSCEDNSGYVLMFNKK